MLIVFFVTLFYVSLVGIFLLFLLKYLELKTGKSIVPENFVLVMEKLALRFFLKVAHLRLYLTKENLVRVTGPLRQKIVRVLLVLQVKFNLYFSKIVDMVRGQGTLIKRGKSSNFLNNVGEYKNLDKGEGSHKFL